MQFYSGLYWIRFVQSLIFCVLCCIFMFVPFLLDIILFVLFLLDIILFVLPRSKVYPFGNFKFS
jgi:hypothetical protein